MAPRSIGLGHFWFYLYTGALLVSLTSCSPGTRAVSTEQNATQGAPRSTFASSEQPGEEQGDSLSASPTPGVVSEGTASNDPAGSTPLPGPARQPVHPIGTGLRRETLPLFIKYKNCPGMVMTGSVQLAAMAFYDLDGWIRVLGAPSLAELEKKAQLAQKDNLPYEALAYGLETGPTTPDEEWQAPVEATKKARALADAYGKLLALGPGERLMSDHPENYAPMAALSDLWVFQTQMYQKEMTFQEYRESVENVTRMIREGRPEIGIWAQIVLPPDRKPSSEYWLDYQDQILTLVDGTYVGVYTWTIVEPETLVGTIDQIFADACGAE